MNTNELMICDLLKWKEQPGFNDEDRNMVLRVKNIFDDAIKIDGRFELYHISLFEPIPLTPEILKKNGWEYNNFNNETVYDEEYYVNENGFDIHINDEKFEVRCIDAVNIQLKYLHELQNALKLCGIKKEIKL